MLSLYQAEWCPYSSRVRQRLTELGVTFAAVPVPAQRIDREEMRRKVGTDEIPALLLENGAGTYFVGALVPVTPCCALVDSQALPDEVIPTAMRTARVAGGVLAASRSPRRPDLERSRGCRPGSAGHRRV